MQTSHVGNIHHNRNCELFVSKLNTVKVLLRKCQAYALWRANNRMLDFMKIWVEARTCAMSKSYR